MKKTFIGLAFTAGSFLLAGCGPEFEDGTSDIDSWEIETDVIEFNHPCMLHTNEDFNRIRQKVNDKLEPWYSGWQKLMEAQGFTRATKAGFTPSAKEVIARADDTAANNFYAMSNDGASAYQLAIAWRISGNDEYAEICTDILDAWASTNKEIIGKEAILVAGFLGYEYANAAEIMRDYEGWSEEKLEAVKKWLTDIVYPICYDWLAANNNLWQSWDLPAMSTIISIGVLCDDSEKVQLAIDYFRDGAGPGCIHKAVIDMHEDPAGKVEGKHLAQSQEMGRDQAHSTLNPPEYGLICQTAWNIGIDLFEYSDYLVRDVCDYIAKYNVNPDEPVDMPFTPHIVTKDGVLGEDGNYWFLEVGQNDKNGTMSEDTRGCPRAGWELLYNHYVKIKKVNAPYIEAFAERVRPEGGGRLDTTNEDGIGFGTLMYTLE